MKQSNTKIFFVIFSIYFISSCSNQIIQRGLFSEISLQPGLSPSDSLKAFADKEGINHVDNRKVEESRLSEYEFTKDLQTDMKHVIEFPKTVGSYMESLEFFFDGVSKDNSSLIVKRNYGYNITYPDDLITTYAKPIEMNSKENNKKHSFDFNFIQPDLRIEFNSTTLEELKDIVAFNNLIIGIHKKDRNLKVYAFIKEQLIKKEAVEIFDEETKKLNLDELDLQGLFIDSNFDSKHRHLMLVDHNRDVYILKFNVDFGSRENELPKIFLGLVTKYNDKRLDKFYIVDFCERKNIFYIGYDEGIVIRDVVKELNYFDVVISLGTDSSVFDLKVRDMQQVNDFIFVVIKDYGLKALKVNDPRSITWTEFEFLHPNLEKISAHMNPYMDYPFLGILVNNRLFKHTEFFIELSLKNPLKPLLYRYYLSNKHFDVKHIISDEEFTYLFENNSNSMLIFSRSITATSQNSFYKFQIKEFANSDVSTPFIFSDENLVHKHLGVIAKNTFTYTEKVELSNAKMEINFKEEGSYIFEFHTFSDYCNMSKELVKMCKVHLNYIVNVIQNKTQAKVESIRNTVIIILVICAILALVIIIFWKKIKEFIKNRQYIQYYNNGTDASSYDKAPSGTTRTPRLTELKKQQKVEVSV